MPLNQAVSFKAVIQKNRRIHILVLVRWRFKLEPGEIFKVHLKLDHRYEDFYGRMGADGRLTVPKVTAKEFLKSEREEQMSIQKFGDDYKRYMEKVPRMNLIAGVLDWRNVESSQLCIALEI